jgi:hypothetical protein
MENAFTYNYPRELNISEMLLIAYNFTLKNFKFLFLYGFIVYLPLNFIQFTFPTFDVLKMPAMNYSDAFTMLSALSASFLLNIFANMPIIIVVKGLLNGKKPSIRTIFKSMINILKQSFRINLATLFFFYLFVTLWLYFAYFKPSLFLVLTVPVIIILVYLIFSVYAFSIKGLNLFKSILYSYKTVHRRWFKVFAYTLVFYLLMATAILALGIPYAILSEHFVIVIFYNTFVNIICTYFVALFTIFFINFDDSKVSSLG